MLGAIRFERGADGRGRLVSGILVLTHSLLHDSRPRRPLELVTVRPSLAPDPPGVIILSALSGTFLARHQSSDRCRE